MKRFLVILLAALMMLSCLVACEGSGDEASGETSANTLGSDAASSSETTSETTTEETTTEETTTAETTGEEIDMDAVKAFYEGKTCVTFGASNTWYDGNPYNWGKEKGVVATGYQHYMRRDLGLTVLNCGVSGLTMPQIVDEIVGTRYKDHWATVDIVTIKGGINDERHGVTMGKLMPKGSDFDRNTFIGSIQYAVEYILEKNPDITIWMFTTTKAWIYAPAGFGKNNPQTEDMEVPERWADAMKEIAELYDLPVCDLYNESGLDYDVPLRVKYFNDPEPPENTFYSTHPNTEGYKLVGKCIVDNFAKYALESQNK